MTRALALTAALLLLACDKPQPAPPSTPVRATVTATRTPESPRATATPLRTAPVPTATATAAPRRCDPSYPDVCIPPYPPDLDCSQIRERRFRVLPPDPHRFDSDRDGIGCES